MFLVVFDHGYDGYTTSTFDTMEEFAEDAIHPTTDIDEIYEIKRVVTFEDVKEYATTRKLAKEQARQNAIAKLTPEDCELLGISR
jgi:hypothetical protein